MISRAKRILVIGMNYAPELAGVGRYTGDLAAELAKRGHDVTVITTPPHYPGWTTKDPYSNKYNQRTEGGVRIWRCPLLLRKDMRGIWRLLAPLSFAITSMPFVFWHFFRHRPNVVLCIEPTLLSAPAALVCSRATSTRTVLHVQDLEVDAAFAVGHIFKHRWLQMLGHWFEHFTLDGFEQIVTISEKMRQRLEEKGIKESRLVVIRNWVDLDKIFCVPIDMAYRRKLGIDLDAFVVLYSGNIGVKQGLGILLGAMEILQKKKNITCVIAGDGPAKPALLSRWRHLRNVHFVPFQPEELFNAFLGLANVHVVPQEGGAADMVLPSKIGGILASGRPLIVTATTGTELANFLANTATVVPPGDVQALASAIANAAEKPEEGDVSRQARLNLASLLDRERAMDAMEAVLISETTSRGSTSPKP